MARLVLVALGAAFGAFAIGLAVREPEALTLPGPVHVGIGLSFLAAGAVALRERPENRMGMLMTLAAIAWFGRDLDWFDSAAAERAGELSLNLFLALVVHQVVVFPQGFARTRLERRLVVATYALALLGYVPSELSELANALLSGLGIALAVCVVYVVVRRWRLADAAERRALRPLVLLGLAVMVVAVATLAHDYLGADLSETGQDVLRWCALVYAALPLVFLAGVIHTHMRRTVLADFLAELSDGAVFDDDEFGEAARAALHALRREQQPPRLEQLTPRELEVLALIAEGRTDRGIAQELFVTPKTVEAHVRSIFRKLDLPRDAGENRRVHAVLTFLRARTP